MKAIVRQIQVGGLWCENSLEDAAKRYIAMINPHRGSSPMELIIPSRPARL